MDTVQIDEALFNIPDEAELELTCPNLEEMRVQRQERTVLTMKAFDTGLMKRTLPDICLQLTLEENSAICIQRYFRGYQGRKRYLQALILKFEEEERLRSKKTLQQLEEGELLLENHRLEVELEDNQCLRRNKEQRRLSQILTIQRAWKKYKRSTVGINFSSSNHGNQRKQLNSTTDASAEDVNGNNVQETRCTITIDTQNSRQPVKSSQTAQNTMSKRMNSKSPVYAVSDLGSDLEIDHCQLSADASPETPSRGRGKLNCNRLSLAEEFATMEEQILGEKALESEEDESDYYGGSSEVTTPEWDSDKIEHHDRPEISLRRGKSPQMNSPDGGDGSMLIGGKRTTLEDSNKYGSDLNANLKSLQDGRNNISNSLQYYTTSDRENMTNPLDKRKVEEIKPEVRIGKVSCGGVESDTTNHSQLMNHSTSSSSNSAQSNFPKVEVSKVKDMCPTCDGVQGTNPTQSDGDVTMPVLDWESLERHLAKMEIEEKNKKQNIEEMPSQQSPRQVQKNSRIEILRKLAMGEEDIEGDIYGKGRDKLSSRLQSGMNLQICFVNDSVDGSDAEEDSGSNATPRVANRDSRFLFSRESSVGSPSSGTSPKTPSVTFEDLEDFESKQARLQAETRIALAQVKEVVKLQMELDRQQKKKSPTTELAGVSGLSDISEGLSNNHFDQKLLQRMSISKLQFIANELHSKIEKLNEELVQLLMTRDELQHGQDSQLVDIEDLTRWIRMSEFRQERGCIHPSQDQDFESNMHQNNNNTLLGHEPMTNNPRRKQAEQTLLKLLGRSLPASGRKCICGVSRSSSVVSNRSASSPEPDSIQRNPLSPTSPQSCRSESSVSESHASSPELTWVRQAIVRYWYN